MYEGFYHLRAKPFRLSPDHRFFFASRVHKEALTFLRYGLSQDEGFVVITGAPGTGKTTLAQILLKEMDRSGVVVAHLTTTQLDAEEMLRMITASFGLRCEGMNKTDLLKTLEGFLLAQSRENRRVLLVVDEAQNLPPRSIEELRMLSNLQVEEKALLQIFLLAQTQFRQTLERRDLEQFLQRVIASYHLTELEEDECQQYIESRLQHVGWQGDPQFTAVAYKEIFKYTQGMPRRINMLCDRLMLFGFLEERHEIDEALVRVATDELQKEMWGKPADASELSYDHDSLYEELDQVSEQVEITKSSEVDKAIPKAGSVNKRSAKKRPGKKSATANGTLPDNNVLKELEAEDEHSTFSMNQAEANNFTLNSNFDSSLDKVMPGDGYDKFVAQQQADEISGENTSRGSKKLRASRGDTQQASKNRFHIISGGQSGRRDDSDRLPEDIANSSSEAYVPAPGEQGDPDVGLRKILRLVLAYHRSPKSFPGLDDPLQPLPEGITKIFSLAASDDYALKNLRLVTDMNISPDMLRDAVRFFIRHVMFLPGTDDYRILGLSPSDAREQIEKHFDLLMQIMRQEKQSYKDGSVARIEESYGRLCRGENVHVAAAPLHKRTEDDLDIDLYPNEIDPNLTGLGVKNGIGQLLDIITGDRHKAESSRHIILASGVIVVVLAFFLTQIMSTDGQDTNADIASSVETQQVLEPKQQNVEASATEVPSKKMTSTQGVSHEIVGAEVKIEQDKNAAADARRQQGISAELLAQTQAKEKFRKEAETIESARLKAELRQAVQAAAQAKARQEEEVAARVRAEAKAEQEAQARALAEAAVIAAKQAQAKAAAKQAQAEAEARALKKTQEKDKAQAKAEAVARAAATQTPTVVAKAQLSQGGNALNTQTDSSPANTVKAVSGNLGDIQVSELNSFVTRPENVYAVGTPASIDELKQVLENFASAYRAGDIERFMALFALDAKTNDHSTLQGIRGDYVELFAGTESRKIDLSAMQWQREGSVSRGEGVYVVKVQPKGKSKIDVYRGKLWFNIMRDGDKLLINYFAFK